METKTAIISYLDLPRGAEWMMRGAYTPSPRVQTAPFGRCWYNFILVTRFLEHCLGKLYFFRPGFILWRKLHDKNGNWKVKNSTEFSMSLLGCPRKLGSMFSKWVISPTYKWGMTWGYIPLIHSPLILTSCPGHPSVATRQVRLWPTRWQLPGLLRRWQCLLSMESAPRSSRHSRDAIGSSVQGAPRWLFDVGCFILPNYMGIIIMPI